MDKDLAQRIQRLSLGEKVALMRFMHLIPDERDDADESPTASRRRKQTKIE